MMCLIRHAICRVPTCLVLGGQTLSPRRPLTRATPVDLTHLSLLRLRRLHPFPCVRPLLLHNALARLARALRLVHGHAPLHSTHPPWLLGMLLYRRFGFIERHALRDSGLIVGRSRGHERVP